MIDLIPIRVTRRERSVKSSNHVSIRTDNSETQRLTYEAAAEQAAQARRLNARRVRAVHERRRQAGRCRTCSRKRERHQHRCDRCQVRENARVNAKAKTKRRQLRAGPRAQDMQQLVTEFERRCAALSHNHLIP
jgi:hypothetical protein